MSFYLNFKIARVWRQKIRRNGGTFEIMILNKAKMYLSFNANAVAFNVDKRNKEIL